MSHTLAPLDARCRTGAGGAERGAEGRADALLWRCELARLRWRLVGVLDEDKSGRGGEDESDREEEERGDGAGRCPVPMCPSALYCTVTVFVSSSRQKSAFPPPVFPVSPPLALNYISLCISSLSPISQSSSSNRSSRPLRLSLPASQRQRHCPNLSLSLSPKRCALLCQFPPRPRKKTQSPVTSPFPSPPDSQNTSLSLC